MRRNFVPIRRVQTLPGDCRQTEKPNPKLKTFKVEIFGCGSCRGRSGVPWSMQRASLPHGWGDAAGLVPQG